MTCPLYPGGLFFGTNNPTTIEGPTLGSPTKYDARHNTT